MVLKDKLTKPLYQNSFDGDSYHSYIRFEDMDKILEEQTKIAQEYARLKCQELLQILAKKAEVKKRYGEKGQSPNLVNLIDDEPTIDKDSIFNAVDLDSFIS